MRQVRAVRAALPETRVAVMLLFPRSKDKGELTPWREVDVVNEMLWEALRGTPHVTIVDCTKPFLADGLVDASLLPDGLHPNGAGAVAWATCLAKVTRRYLAPLPAPPAAPGSLLDLSSVV